MSGRKGRAFAGRPCRLGLTAASLHPVGLALNQVTLACWFQRTISSMLAMKAAQRALPCRRNARASNSGSHDPHKVWRM